jgi:hypothetical protein
MITDFNKYIGSTTHYVIKNANLIKYPKNNLDLKLCILKWCIKLLNIKNLKPNNKYPEISKEYIHFQYKYILIFKEFILNKQFNNNSYEDNIVIWDEFRQFIARYNKFIEDGYYISTSNKI